MFVCFYCTWMNGIGAVEHASFMAVGVDVVVFVAFAVQFLVVYFVVVVIFSLLA